MHACKAKVELISDVHLLCKAKSNSSKLETNVKRISFFVKFSMLYVVYGGNIYLHESSWLKTTFSEFTTYSNSHKLFQKCARNFVPFFAVLRLPSYHFFPTDFWRKNFKHEPFCQISRGTLDCFFVAYIFSACLLKWGTYL